MEEEAMCQKCLGSGFYSDCFDDMCHGNEECIHGDDATCSECNGEGVMYFSAGPAPQAPSPKSPGGGRSGSAR